MKSFDDIFDTGEINDIAKDAMDKAKEHENIVYNEEETAEDNLPVTLTDDLERQLQSLSATDSHDKDMDLYANEAYEAFKQLMDTGNNFSDTRFSGKFYEAAVQMLSNAITAKNSKVTAKLKKMEVLLKAEKLLQSRKEPEDDIAEKGQIIATRTEVLNALKETKE